MANILIADADIGIRQMIMETLQDSNHTFYQAEDGNSAMEMIQKNSIQIVLADREIPGKDGIEMLQEIKKSRPQMPVVLMLGLEEEDSEEILDAGAFAILTKPFNLQDVRRVIAEAVPHSLQALATAVPGATGKEREKDKKVGKLVWIIAALVFLGLSIGGGIWYALSHRAPPIRIFLVPYANSSGITFAGKFFWSCDWFNQSFYQHEMDALLTLRKTFNLEEFHPTGIVWDGKNFWSVSSWSKKILRHKMNGRLQIEQEFPCPVPEPSALGYDGQFFWLCDARESKIVKFSIENNQVKVWASANSPGQKPIGIYADKKNLWTADSRSGLIYKHRMDQNFKVIEVYALPDELQKEKISCFSSDGTTFWIGTESSQKIFQVHPKHLKLIGITE